MKNGRMIDNHDTSTSGNAFRPCTARKRTTSFAPKDTVRFTDSTEMTDEFDRLLDEQRELTLQVKAKNESLFMIMSDILNRVGKNNHNSNNALAIDNVANHPAPAINSNIIVPILDDDILAAEQELLQQKSALTSQLGSLLERMQDLQRRGAANANNNNNEPRADSQLAQTIALRRPLPPTQMYRHIEEFELKNKDLHDRLAGLTTKIATLEERDDAKSKRIDELSNENAALASQHSQLTQELADARRRAVDAEQRLSALTNASKHNVSLLEQRRSSESANAERRIGELDRQVGELTQQLHTVRASLATAEQQAAAANQSANDATARAATATLAHEALRAQFEQLQTDRRQQLEQQRTTHEHTLLAMQQQLDHANAELQQIDQLRHEREQLLNQLRDLQQQKPTPSFATRWREFRTAVNDPDEAIESSKLAPSPDAVLPDSSASNERWRLVMSSMSALEALISGD